MILCSSRPLNSHRMLSLQLDAAATRIAIYLIDQVKDEILASKITLTSASRGLLVLFGSNLHSLYRQLSREDCEVAISDEQGRVSLEYEVVSVMEERTLHKLSLPTQHYLPNGRRRFPSENEIICEGDYSFQKAENKQVLADVRSLEGHQGWFYNTREKVFLQLGSLKPPREEEEGRQWDTFTHLLSINLNKYHSADPPKYDLTFGLAPPEALPLLRQDCEAGLGQTVSVTVLNRKVYCQCLGVREEQEFSQVVSPESLQLFVTRRAGLRTGSIEVMLNQHKLVNVLTEDMLRPLEEGLRGLEEFVPFVYLRRSFLHFSFKAEAKQN